MQANQEIMSLQTASTEGEERCAAALQGQQELQDKLQEQSQVVHFAFFSAWHAFFCMTRFCMTCFLLHGMTSVALTACVHFVL